MKEYEQYKTDINKILMCDEDYYNNHKSTTDDYVYDETFKRIQTFEKKYPNKKLIYSPTNTVGSKITKNKMKHLTKMYSMDNVYNLKEFNVWYNKFKVNSFFLDYKIDGISLNIIYKDGKLFKAITRGDGTIGEDVTENVLFIKNIPKTLNQDMEVRGEVILTTEAFNKLNESRSDSNLPLYKNARNAVSGLISKKLHLDRDLEFIVWGVGKSDHSFKTHKELIDHLDNIGFKTTFYKTINNTNDVKHMYNYTIENRDEIPYTIDGLVVRVNDLNSQKELGYTVRAPKFMIALKLPPVSKFTTITSIVDQVGRTGVITPVGVLKPIELGGTVIRRVNLHNYNYVRKLNLNQFDKISIVRSGDTIPKILNVEHVKNSLPFLLPTLCPSCNDKLVHSGDLKKIFCINPDCREMNILKLTHFVSKRVANIVDFSKETITYLYDNCNIKDKRDIYSITPDTLSDIPNFKDRKISKVMTSIVKSKTITYSNFLYSLDIEFVGKTNSKLIVNKLGDRFLNGTEEEVLSINGIGDRVANSYYSYIYLNKKYIEEFKSIFTLIPDNKTLFKVAITGKFDIPRKDIENEIINLGGEVTTVDKAKYVLIGDKPSKSKIKNLNKDKTILYNRHELIKMIE